MNSDWWTTTGDLTAPAARWVNITFFPLEDVDEVLEAFQYHVAIFYDGDLSGADRALWGESHPADHQHGWPDGLNATSLYITQRGACARLQQRQHPK